MQADSLVALAVVVRPHGLGGDIRVRLFNPDSDLLLHARDVLLRHGDEVRDTRLEHVRRHQRDVAIVRVQGLDSRNQAEALRGAELCVPRSALPELQPGEYYHRDLAGLAAVLPDGACLGEVERVLAYPAADVLVVRSEKGKLEVPMFDPYLLQIDLEAGQVVVDCVEDLAWSAPKNRKMKKRQG